METATAGSDVFANVTIRNVVYASSGGTRYRMLIPRSCLGDPAEVSAAAYAVFESNAEDQEVVCRGFASKDPDKFLYAAARGLWGNHNKLDPDVV